MLSIVSNQIMIEHYKEITNVTSHCIQITMKEYHIEINGTNLRVLALGKAEILVEGNLEGLRFIHET